MNIINKIFVNQKKRGFTLIELLIIVGIVGLLSTIILASIKSSKDKAADLDTRKTMSELALKAEEQEIAPGVLDYNQAFNFIKANETIQSLALKLGLSTSDYEYFVDKNEYAIVFPLKKGNYYCIDSLGKATGKEVVGLFQTSGPKNCSTATRIATGGSNNFPVITFSGGDFYDPAPDSRDAGICSLDACVTPYDPTDPDMDPYAIANLLGLENETDPRVTAYQIDSRFSFPLFGFTASDIEDGIITDRLDYGTEAIFRAYNQSTITEAQAVLNYINSMNGSSFSIRTDRYTCNSSFVQYDVEVTDNDGNRTVKNFKVYACDLRSN